MRLLQQNAIEKLLAENNGILKTADVVAVGISKETFYKYVKDAGLERTAAGFLRFTYFAKCGYEETPHLRQPAASGTAKRCCRSIAVFWTKSKQTSLCGSLESVIKRKTAISGY